jgi:phospholipid/cholesterol/gamma-HCH transport system substrate-binding protein
MNRIQRDTLLGIVFFGTLAFLLWATINLTDVSFNRVPPLKVAVPDGGGVRNGDAVLLLGKRVGKVTDIDIQWQKPQNRVQLTLSVSEAISFRVGYKIEIQPANLLGSKQVYIDPGVGTDAPYTGELVGVTAVDPLQSAGRFFDGDGPSGSELKGALIELNKFLHSLNDPDGTIGAIVKRRELYDEIFASAQSLRSLFQSVERGDGVLGRVIKDTNLRDDLLHIVQNLSVVSDRLNSTESVVGRLLNDRELALQLGGIVQDIGSIVARVKEGHGIAGRLLSDEELAQKLGDAITSLASVLKKADDPSAGPLGMLFGDLEVRTQLKQIAANVASITEKIDTGKGVLGLLIGDEEMGIRLRRILNQVSRALEDAREAAPISNFVQVFLGAL